MESAYEHHVVKAGNSYQLRIFQEGHLVHSGEYKSYAEAMQALIKFQKSKEQ